MTLNKIGGDINFCEKNGLTKALPGPTSSQFNGTVSSNQNYSKQKLGWEKQSFLVDEAGGCQD